MSQQNVFSRISGWFRAKPSGENEGAMDLPLAGDAAAGTGTQTPEPPAQLQVTTFLRPWAKRDQAMAQLQQGFNTLSDLLASVKDNLDRQSQRQEQLLKALQCLPDALRAIPENSRMQTETLKAVGEQLRTHNVHYHRLADVLEKVADSSAEQQKILDCMQDRMGQMTDHDRSISDGMRSVSSAMEQVSQNSQASTQVLDQMKNNVRSRDMELQWILHRQGVRFTAMLAVAIFLSIAALAAVCVIGWKMLG